MRHFNRRRTAKASPPAAMIVAAVVALACTSSAAGSAAGPGPGSGVAVVDFYAPGHLPFLLGVFPETLAADDLAGVVARSGGGQISVIPRSTVRQAESALGWQGSDVLRFARLVELARALNADLLLLGWIERLFIDRDGRDDHLGISPVTGFATLRVQVFDPRESRIVAQAERSADEMGYARWLVAQRLIRRAVEAAVPSILPALTGGR